MRARLPVVLANFAEACSAVTSYLRESNPSAQWAVSTIEGDRRECVASAPADARDDQLGFGAHIEVPIARSDGSVYGILSGTDTNLPPADLESTRSLLQLLADMLARDLDSEERRIDAERATDSARNDADTDSLTGLWNRRGWNRFVDSAQHRSSVAFERGSIVAIDLNGVKSINDNHGHAAGDEYIRRAGAALHKSVHYPYVAARLGGDEFGVIAVDSSEDHVADLADLIAEIGRQFGEADVTSSIGHAPITPSGGITEAWQRADDNMYANKRRTPADKTQVASSGFERNLEYDGRIGSFIYDSTGGPCYWSPETYRILGYQPGDVVPTADLWLHHHHPDDREYAVTLLRHVGTTGLPFRNQFRVVDTRGRIRSVLALGETERPRGDGGTHVNGRTRITGYLIDLDASAT